MPRPMLIPIRRATRVGAISASGFRSAFISSFLFGKQWGWVRNCAYRTLPFAAQNLREGQALFRKVFDLKPTSKTGSTLHAISVARVSNVSNLLYRGLPSLRYEVAATLNSAHLSRFLVVRNG